MNHYRQFCSSNLRHFAVKAIRRLEIGPIAHSYSVTFPVRCLCQHHHPHAATDSTESDGCYPETSIPVEFEDHIRQRMRQFTQSAYHRLTVDDFQSLIHKPEDRIKINRILELYEQSKQQTDIRMPRTLGK